MTLLKTDVPRLEITLHNRAAGDATCARYEAHQVPSAGDLIYAHGGVYTKGTPFEKQFVWRVDAVIWQVSSPGSHNGIQWAVHRGLEPGSGVCFQVDLLVWPDQGPYWPDHPEWAWREPEEDETETAAQTGDPSEQS